MALGALRQATGELSWLLSRGYAEHAALKLVGDHHQLAARQRLAVLRCSCGEEQRQRRASRVIPFARLTGEQLEIDAYNVLITVESALAGRVVLRGQDHCLRDLASIHGAYRTAELTTRVIRAVGEHLTEFAPRAVRWLLDRPISNSGRLKALIEEIAGQCGWPWAAELHFNPDRQLAGAEAVVATCDSWILDRCTRRVDLTGEVIARHAPEAWIIDLGQPGAQSLAAPGTESPAAW